MTPQKPGRDLVQEPRHEAINVALATGEHRPVLLVQESVCDAGEGRIKRRCLAEREYAEGRPEEVPAGHELAAPDPESGDVESREPVDRQREAEPRSSRGVHGLRPLGRRRRGL